MRLSIKYFAAVLMFAAVSHPSKAEPLSITNLLGRWCGTESNYTFTRTRLSVTRFDGKKLKHGPVIKIADVKATEQWIEIHWLPVKPNNNTIFEVSSDKKVLIQRQNTTGDKGPRREFHRC